MRVSSACSQCRQAKRRCTRQSRRKACVSCSQRHLICQDKISAGYGRRVSLCPRRPHITECNDCSADHPTLNVELSHGTILELVDLYLDKFHGRPYCLFHPATLRSRARDAFIRPPLLYAICAVASRFSSNPETRQQNGALFDEARRLLQAEITEASVENLQACVLVALLSVGHGDVASEIIFFRVATTMAEILDLGRQSAEASAIKAEEMSRIWFSLYITDLWCLSGQGLHSQMKDVALPLPLPIGDSAFMTLSHHQIADFGGTSEPGIWSQLVTLVPLFAPIYAINRSIASGEHDVVKHEQHVSSFANKLELWKTQLPSAAQMSASNLQHQQRLGLGGMLISLHLVYHHFSLLLYFPFLESSRPPKAAHKTYAERCKVHASMFSSLLLQSRQLKGCDIVYPNIAHMTTVASSVLVHTLLLGDMEELGPARQELAANFEALVEVTKFWPATSTMIDRLLVFQQMCISSMDQGTHRLDGWMLDFLVNHSLEKGRADPVDTFPGRVSDPAEQLIQGRLVGL